MDYNDIGLNENMTSLSSPLAVKPRMTGQQFDYNYVIQARNIRVSNLIQKTSDIGTATFIGAVNGTSVTVDTTFSDGKSTNPYQKYTFGIPYLAVYTGTSAVAGNQIYPSFGANIANSKYVIHSGFDYTTWNGTNSTFAVNIENNSGTTTNFFAVAQWKKLAFNQESERLG